MVTIAVLVMGNGLSTRNSWSLRRSNAGQYDNQYILTLEGSLQEEMSCHAPLYDVGLKDLTMKELETLARIHEEGLHQIHALQH
ncbi:hypothetical protein RND81_09G186400 [Saponaria officinalis]|uniref:Uncharacterized protein n=1 Tax=Saponaria officinalis TaxID=3572 RepID=A0AAW1IPP3_SAPOF